MRPPSGFTLWELMLTLALAGVVLGAGVPAFQALLLDARRTADVNALVLAIQLARSEAAKRNRSVIVCKTDDRLRCGSTGLRFDAGWMVYVNSDDQYPPERSPSEELLYAHVPELTGTITANRTYFEFRAGKRSTNGTIVFCDRRGASAARAVIVNVGGRPRVATVDANRKPLLCPP